MSKIGTFSLVAFCQSHEKSKYTRLVSDYEQQTRKNFTLSWNQIKLLWKLALCRIFGLPNLFYQKKSTNSLIYQSDTDKKSRQIGGSKIRVFVTIEAFGAPGVPTIIMSDPQPGKDLKILWKWIWFYSQILSISDILWDLERDLDSATQTYLVPDLSGLLKLNRITDLTKDELNFIIYCPSITIHQLSILRRNSRHPDSRKSRAIFRELKQLIRNRNPKVKLQSDIEESHVHATSPGPQTPADRVIHAALFLRQSGKAVKIISNNQSFKDKARSSGLEILHHQRDLEVSDEPVEVQQPILEETPMTDLELRQSKSILICIQNCQEHWNSVFLKTVRVVNIAIF